MNHSIPHRSHNSYVVALLIVALWLVAFLLGGCADSPPWGGWSMAPTPGQLEAARRGPTLTYVYYPDYEVYYSRTLNQFIYQTPGGWVERSSPPENVTEAMLDSSPSVEISLPGPPSQHHATVAQAHPGRAGIPPARSPSVP